MIDIETPTASPDIVDFADRIAAPTIADKLTKTSTFKVNVRLMGGC